MKALRWTLVGLLLLGLLIGEAALIFLYFAAGITGGFPMMLQQFPWVYYSMVWGIFLLPLIVFGGMSFHFTCEKRFPRLTLLGLIAPFLVVVYCVWVFVYANQNDTRGRWQPFQPLATDYVCTPNKAVRVTWYGYSYYYYTPKMTTSASAQNYQGLKKALGALLSQCKNAKGEHVPRHLPPKPVPAKAQ